MVMHPQGICSVPHDHEPLPSVLSRACFHILVALRHPLPFLNVFNHRTEILVFQMESFPLLHVLLIEEPIIAVVNNRLKSNAHSRHIKICFQELQALSSFKCSLPSLKLPPDHIFLYLLHEYHIINNSFLLGISVVLQAMKDHCYLLGPEVVGYVAV